MVVWGALEARYSVVFAADDRTKDRGSYAWSLGGVLLGLAAALVLDLVAPPLVDERDQPPFLLAGAAIVAAGVALRWWSIHTLGRFFTYQVSTAADHRVVDGGPYHVVRHPSYTALLVSCLGAGVSSANIASLLAVLLIPVIGLRRRILVEEQVLLDELGDDYRRFAARRKRLIPFIW